jgi:hypothetical protein
MLRGLAVPVLATCSVLAFSACKRVEQGEMPICLEEVAGNEADEVATQDVPPDVWFGVVLKNYNARTNEVRRPVVDCSNKSLETTDEEIALCIQPDKPSPALPPRPLDEEEDLLLTPTEEGGQALIWIRTEYYEDGYAMGPVALAEWTKRGIAVRALGPLRAHPNKIRMRLEPMDKGRVLVVESNVCEPETKKCRRVMRLLPLIGYRFEERPLVDAATGDCLGPSTFDLFKEKTVELDDGRQRKFQLTRSFDFSEGNVVLTEQVKIEDSDPRQPEAPPDVFRNANVERPMHLDERGVATGEGLWERMISEHGTVKIVAPKAATPGDDAQGDDAGADEDAADAG